MKVSRQRNDLLVRNLQRNGRLGSEAGAVTTAAVLVVVGVVVGVGERVAVPRGGVSLFPPPSFFREASSSSNRATMTALRPLVSRPRSFKFARSCTQVCWL